MTSYTGRGLSIICCFSGGMNLSFGVSNEASNTSVCKGITECFDLLDAVPTSLSGILFLFKSPFSSAVLGNSFFEVVFISLLNYQEVFCLHLPVNLFTIVLPIFLYSLLKMKIKNF